MNKQEFLSKLRKRISDLPSDEIEERISFYGEMIDDLTEEGLTEEEAVSKIGNIDEIVSQILSDNPESDSENKKSKHSMKAWQTVLLILGAPIWLSLLIAVAAVVFSLYIGLWAVVISLWAVFASFIGSAVGFVLGGIIFIYTNKSVAGIAIIASALVLAGLSIFLFYLCKTATKGMLWISGKRKFASVKRRRIMLAIITAIALIVVGLIIFVSLMSTKGWDFTVLNTSKNVENTYEINEDFDSISLKTVTSDIVFLPSEDGKCRVICFEEEKAQHSVSVKDSTLEITMVNNKKWYEHISINFTDSKLTVYLPEKEYTALYVKETTGDIHIKDIDTNKIDVSLTTGDVDISSVLCTSIGIKGTTGDINLTDIIASEKMTLKQTTGDITLNRCDAKEVFAKTTSGDIKGSLLSEKTFITKVVTGSIDVPRTSTGGRCELTTTTGDIKIVLKTLE